jgi:hypothetical protein
VRNGCLHKQLLKGFIGYLKTIYTQLGRKRDTDIMEKTSMETVVMRLAIGMEIGPEMSRAVVDGVCKEMEEKGIFNEDAQKPLKRKVRPPKTAVKGKEKAQETEPIKDTLEDKVFNRSYQIILRVLSARSQAKSPEYSEMLKGGVLKREKAVKMLIGASNARIIGVSSAMVSKEIACVLLEITPYAMLVAQEQAV